MLTWMMYTLAISTLIGAGGLAAERIARTRRLPTRWVWCATLGATLAATAISWRFPDAPAPARVIATRDVPGSIPSPSSTVGARAPRPTVRVSFDRVATIGWLTLSALTIAFIAMSAVQLERRRRRWGTTTLCGEHVLVSDGLGPAVLGFIKPMIAVPTWVALENPARQQLIIDHEREHRRAGDQRVIALSWIAIAMLPWNVVIAWMIGRLRIAIEMDCDARVMRANHDLRTYVELLIDVSRRPAARLAGVTAFAERPSNVELRIMALTREHPRHPKLVAVALSAAMIAMITVACEIPRPAGPGAGQPRANSTRQAQFTESAAPLSANAAAAVTASIAQRYSAIGSRGSSPGEALWFVADRNDRVIESFAGPSYSDSEFRRMARAPSRDSLDLEVYVSQLTATNGKPINVVWTKDREPASGREYVGPPTLRLLRDSIQALEPGIAAGLKAGRSAYASFDWKNKRFAKIWEGPSFGDRKALWEYVSLELPGQSRMYLTPVEVTVQGGRTIPVVYINRIPWTERYGAR